VLKAPSRRDVELGLIGIGLGIVNNGFRSLATDQRLVHRLRWDTSPAALRLRVRTWIVGCVALLGLAGAIGRMGALSSSTRRRPESNPSEVRQRLAATRDDVTPALS
jgi:hypothetical protein